MALRTLLILAILVLGSSSNLLADEKVARNLILSQGCKGCHLFEESGGSLAPSLDQVGEKLSYEQLRQKLLFPKKTNPDTVMPDYQHLTEDEVRALAQFLSSRGKRK